MNITLNGETTVIATTQTLERLLSSMDVKFAGVAIVINGNVIPKSQWQATQINDGDAIDIFSAVAGG